MVKVSIELECDADEVIPVLRRITPGVASAGAAPIAPPLPLPEPATTAPVSQPQEPAPGPWTTELARDFITGLEPKAREVLGHAWRAGAAGIHRNALRQRTGLTSEEIRPLLMRMGHRLRRLQRERGQALTRPVRANSPLQSYFVDPGFAAAASAPMFSADR